MKDYTADQIVEIIDRNLKQTARDVREGRVPLDGRARPFPKEPVQPGKKSTIPDAAE